MCGRLLLFSGLLGLLYSTNAVTISKCKLGDSDCTKLSAQSLIPIIADGIPEYGIKSLDPLHIQKIDGSSPDLKLIATDVVITGLKGCNVHQITRDPSKINVDLLCSVNVKGEYEMKGKILVLPIDGKGHMLVSLSKVLISVQGDYKEIEHNGKKHWDILNWSFSYDLRDKANIELTDLFAGNAELTEAMKALFGESANEIVKEVGPPIVKAVASEVVDTIKQLFHHVPVEDLTIQ